MPHHQRLSETKEPLLLVPDQKTRTPSGHTQIFSVPQSPEPLLIRATSDNINAEVRPSPEPLLIRTRATSTRARTRLLSLSPPLSRLRCHLVPAVSLEPLCVRHRAPVRRRVCSRMRRRLFTLAPSALASRSARTRSVEALAFASSGHYGGDSLDGSYKCPLT